MKVPIIFLAFILFGLTILNPSAFTKENGDSKDYQVYAYRRREPTIHEVIVASFRKASAQAIQVFTCESGLDPRVVSWTGDYGVAQINLKAHWNKIPGDTKDEKVEWLYNYKNNIRFARTLYDASRWNPWVCAKTLGLI